MDKELKQWLDKGIPEDAIDYFEDSGRAAVWDINSEKDCPARDEVLDSISTLAAICRKFQRQLQKVKND